MPQRTVMTPSVSTEVNEAKEDGCEEILIVQLRQSLKLSGWMRMASNFHSERTTSKLTEAEPCYALKNSCCLSRATL